VDHFRAEINMRLTSRTGAPEMDDRDRTRRAGPRTRLSPAKLPMSQWTAAVPANQ
jgi:hypothetical protein